MKRIFSLLSVLILCAVLFCVPAFAVVDIRDVDIVYSNKIDNSTAFIGCSFGESGNVPLSSYTKKNERFKTVDSFSTANLKSPAMIVNFRRVGGSVGLSGEDKYSGKFTCFGSPEGDSRMTFSFTFEASPKAPGFADPRFESMGVGTNAFMMGEASVSPKWIYIDSNDLDVSVTRKTVNSSYYYTYTVSFFEDDVGVPFHYVRFIIRFGSGSYYYAPMLRGYSGSSESRYDYENSIDAEKNEAQKSGNENVDKLTGAIGIDTSGFLSGFQNLASAMSYDGTDANWTMPAIYIPEIQGITDRIDLTDEQPINLVSFVDKIPDNILDIIRALFDIALVVFCGKELYDLISYLFTLKGGGSDG